MSQAFVANVSILIASGAGCVTQSDACEWVSGLLSEHPQVRDWSYPLLARPIGDETHQLPCAIEVGPTYEEGDAFNLPLTHQQAGQLLIDFRVTVEELLTLLPPAILNDLVRKII